MSEARGGRITIHLAILDEGLLVEEGKESRGEFGGESWLSRASRAGALWGRSGDESRAQV